jgi:SEC-C motif
MHQRNSPWYQRGGGSRLAQDQASIAEMFPGLSYRVDETAGRVFLEGTITLVAECGVPTPIVVRVEFPSDYPQGEPHIFEIAGRFPHVPDRHFFADGQCCLWLPPESRWKPDDPEGLCRFLEEAAVFFDQQLVYEAEGKGIWPSEQRSHGDEGYLEFVQEVLGGGQQLLAVFAPILLGLRTGHIQSNDQCPCGSRRKYKRCHKQHVEEVRRRMGSDFLQYIVGQWYTHTTETKKM